MWDTQKGREDDDREKVTTLADRMSLVTFGRAVSADSGEQKTEKAVGSRSEEMEAADQGCCPPAGGVQGGEVGGWL